MGNEVPQHNASDEIDLGQLFRAINNGFKRLFRSFLKAFAYLKKNAIILSILVVLGLGAGYVLKMFRNERLMTEVIVKPNFNSKNYLYDVIDEIQSNIGSRDSIFFKNIGLNVGELQGAEIKIEPIEEDSSEEITREDMQYLDMLIKNFNEEGFVQEIVRAEITKKNAVDHRITFYYLNTNKAKEQISKILAYINSNEHYAELGTIYQENLRARIEKNTILISQIDELISNYSKGLAERDKTKSDGSIYLDNEGGLNIPSLLGLKTRLGKEVESKKIELAEQNSVVRVINFGKSQKVRKSVFGNVVFVIPGIFLLLFFFISFIKFLNKKAKEL